MSTNFTIRAGNSIVNYNFCTQKGTRTPTALRPLVPETSVSTNSTIWAKHNINLREKKRNTHVSLDKINWSERRDSNPRPRPWQGRALPTELLSHFVFYIENSISMFNKSCSTIPIAIGRATFAIYMYLLVSPYQAFNFSIEVQRYFLFDNLQILKSKKMINFSHSRSHSG